MSWVPSVPKISEAGDIVLEAEAGFVKVFLDWIAAFIRGTQRAVTGELVYYDFAMMEKARWAFTSAVIRALAFPTLDAARDDVGRMTITARASSVKPLPRSTNGSAPPPLAAMAQTLWRCCDFSVTVAGLDPSATSKVSHVDAISATPGVSADVRLLVQESALPHFVAWQKEGTPADSTIVYRRPNLQALFTLSFSARAGAIAPTGATMGSGSKVRAVSPDSITRVPVSLKVTSLSLSA
jgi:hypothetical protein